MLALQEAIYSRLSGNAALSTLVSGVFDHVPQDTQYPYVSMGEADVSDWSGAGFTGYEVTQTILVFSRYKGRREAYDIQELIIQELHDSDLAVSGFNHVNSRFVDSRSALGEDGLSYVAQLKMRFVITRI